MCCMYIYNEIGSGSFRCDFVVQLVMSGVLYERIIISRTCHLSIIQRLSTFLEGDLIVSLGFPLDHLGSFVSCKSEPVFFFFHIQYTINSKKVEVAVKKIISGEDIEQRGALANPNSLNLYYNIPQLQTLENGH